MFRVMMALVDCSKPFDMLMIFWSCSYLRLEPYLKGTIFDNTDNLEILLSSLMNIDFISMNSIHFFHKFYKCLHVRKNSFPLSMKNFQVSFTLELVTKHCILASIHFSLSNRLLLWLFFGENFFIEFLLLLLVLNLHVVSLFLKVFHRISY